MVETGILGYWDKVCIIIVGWEDRCCGKTRGTVVKEVQIESSKNS